MPTCPQIRTALRSTGAVDLKGLAIDNSHGWAVFLDIYVLDADGALLDVCLLAAVAALLGLHLPHVEINDQGKVGHSPRAHQYFPLEMQLLQKHDIKPVHIHKWGMYLSNSG